MPFAIHQIIRFVASIVLLTFVVCSSKLFAQVDEQAVLHTNESIVPSARLVSFDSAGKWLFNADGNQTAIDQAALVRWGAWSGSLRKSAVWLADGSWIAGRIEFISTNEITVHSDWFQAAKVPIRDVRAMVMVAPASLNAWNELQSRLASVSGARDSMWLKGNRQVSGVLRIGVDEFDRQPRFVLENAGQSLDVDSTDVLAIAFSPALIGPVPDQAKQSVLALDDGSRLNVRKLGEVQGRIRIELSNGVVLQSLDALAEFCGGITCLSNQPANTTFLSAVEPANYKHIAQSQLEWPLGRNRDLFDRPLMTSTELSGIVDRGLATHSSSQVAFRLDGSRQKFLAEVALAKPAEGADERLGSVTCQVLVARANKLQVVETFALDRTRSASHLVDVDLSTGQLLVLVTEQSDFAQYADHVLWFDARIAKLP